MPANKNIASAHCVQHLGLGRTGNIRKHGRKKMWADRQHDELEGAKKKSGKLMLCSGAGAEQAEERKNNETSSGVRGSRKKADGS